MKWYFACNDKSQNFYPLIKGAVNSALKNTTLEPHFIYDGEENDFTQWLREKGVKIIHHKVSFYEALKNHYNENLLNIASGAFLRCDIPIIEQEDDFVLYTDCDVMFLKDFKNDLNPKYFACSTQFDKKNFNDFNTGVMVMNVKKLRESHAKFSEFIINNLSILNAFDQTAYQIFYSSKNTKLSTEFNHKPYWGVDDNAFIIHFHGPKPFSFTTDKGLMHMPTVHYQLYIKDKNAYDFYLDMFKSFNKEIQYDEEGIEKLKIGVYPLIKLKSASLIYRIKLRLIKEFKIITSRLRN